MGFSIVTVFEVLHCICKGIVSIIRENYKAIAVRHPANNTLSSHQQLTTQSTFNGSINTRPNLDEVAIRMEPSEDHNKTESHVLEERIPDQNNSGEKAQFL